MKTTFLFIIAVFLLTGCKTIKETSITNTVKRDKLKNNEVFVFYKGDSLPKESVKIGDIEIGDNGFTTKCSKDEVINDAINIAKSNNSNILLIDELEKPGYSGSCYGLKARFFYNNSVNMNRLWKESNNVFDKNADYSLVYFICTGEIPSIYTYMKAGLVGRHYRIFIGDENFKITEVDVIAKKIKKEGITKITGTSYTRFGEVELNLKNGHEYFVRVTTHTSFGTRVVLEKLSTVEGKKLKDKVDKIVQLINEAHEKKKAKREKRKRERKLRRK